MSTSALSQSAIAGMSMNTMYGPLNISPGAGQMSQIDEINHLSGRGMSIRIVPANGGTIISIRDENNIVAQSNLYIVPEGQDIATELGKIITLHYLKA
jgi:hypothetical protein